MRDRVHVAHFLQDFSRQSETFVYDYLCEQEKKEGLRVEVLTLNRINSDQRPFPNVTEVSRPGRWSAERLFWRAAGLVRGRPPRTANWPQTRERIARALDQAGPDVLHCHFGPAGVLAAPVAQQLDLPLVVTFYGRDVSSLPKKEFWRAAYEELWPRADAVTVLSNEMKASVEKLGCPPGKIEVVHLSRNLEEFPFHPPSQSVHTLLFVGRLVPKKGPLDAVRAVERASRQGVDLVLEMVGDGSLREDVEAYVRTNDLSDRVTIHGRLPNKEVARHMRAADAFLLPSKTAPDGDREGTPTVLVEAQASGLPCVSTRHAGIPEMIPEESHDFLVEEGDVLALSEALSRLADLSPDELSNIAHQGRQKMERDFSLSGEVGRLIDTYSAVSATMSAEAAK